VMEQDKQRIERGIYSKCHMMHSEARGDVLPSHAVGYPTSNSPGSHGRVPAPTFTRFLGLANC
jgi:hypothetical protein